MVLTLEDIGVVGLSGHNAGRTTSCLENKTWKESATQHSWPCENKVDVKRGHHCSQPFCTYNKTMP